ncbi:MAG TPA: 50S ribosomal protein L30 [Gemmatimonadales bacterium]|nr:50S ribosomal protein L30 [Gemmatimonadales bacterium]
MPESKKTTAAKRTKTAKAKTTKKAKATKKAAPKKRAPKKPAAATAQRLRIKQVRSGLGHAETYRRTLAALGLRHQREVVLPDTPSIRGMLHKVHHLVRVTPEEA